jgi:opacity protein-like surface antigen
MWYSFTQSGEFVDVADNEIFTATLRSTGWAPLLHAGAGVDLALSSSLLLASEARYSFAKADMQEDFAGFDRIDLSGLNVTFGLKVRF